MRKHPCRGAIPPADPAGAQPRRDHRCLARVSRHEVAKTPGRKTHFRIYDPARVSHSPVRQSVRHPSGVAGIEPHRNPESSGSRPSTAGLKNGHPCRGASLPYRTGRTGQTGRTAQETPGIRQGSPARLTIPSTNPAVIITSYPACQGTKCRRLQNTQETPYINVAPSFATSYRATPHRVAPSDPLLRRPTRGRGFRVCSHTSVTGLRMTDAYGVSTPAGVTRH